MKKHFKLLIAALLVGSVAFFSACGDDDDDDDDVTIEAPTLNFLTGDDYTADGAALAEGDAIKIGVTAQQPGAAGELSSIEVIASLDGTATTIMDSTITGTQFTIDINETKSDADSETWTFTVTNSDGQEVTKTMTFTLEAEETPFDYENTADGAIYHRWGQYPGAYDLAMNTTMSQSEPDEEKDMVNTSVNGEAFTATWKAGDGNTTTFVKAEGYDYENATVESANAALAGGDPVSEITTEAAAGDVYIASLRGTGEPCVIYIQEVSQDDPLKSGTGYMYFAYKKTSENAGQ